MIGGILFNIGLYYYLHYRKQQIKAAHLEELMIRNNLGT